MAQRTELWSSRLGFLFATIGSAVGLGSVWKFPYEVGTNGGGAFVLVYLAGLAVVVFPLMLVEFAIGRRGRSDATRSLEVVARAARASPAWAWVGVLGVVTATLILSFYSVIGGWTLAYLVETGLDGLVGADPQAVRLRFDRLLAAPMRMTFYHAAFMAIVALIVARGIVAGIERAATVLMPILLALIVLLAGYAALEGDLVATARFMFAVDPRGITAKAALDALGLGFFSIGVGLAVMITYAAHADRAVDLPGIALTSILADTAISFLSGFAVFPVVFAHGLDPAGGPGLMFVSLPIAFGALPFGTLAAIAFFALLAVTAIASAISLLEMPVAFLQSRTGMARPLGVVVSAGACWAAGLATVWSFNLWADWFPLADIAVFRRSTAFDLIDHLTSNLLLPLGGLALAVFGGWIVPVDLLADELSLGRNGRRFLRALLRYVVPVAIAATALSPYLV